MKGAFPVSGEEVQFAKMTEAEKGKEGRQQSQTFSGEKALCQSWRLEFTAFRFETGGSRIVSTHISWERGASIQIVWKEKNNM